MGSFKKYTLLTSKRSGKIRSQNLPTRFKLHCVFQQMLLARQTTCNNIKNARLKVCLTSLGLVQYLHLKEKHKRPSELEKISITKKWKIERKPC